MRGEARQFKRGVALLNARRFVSARRDLTAVALADGALAPWAVQELVQTYLRRGEAAHAEAALRQILPAASPLLAHGVAYLCRRTGRAAEALPAFEALCKRRPMFWPAALELGWMWFASGRQQEGLRLLRRAARTFERKRDTWGLASALTHLGTAAWTQFRLRETLELFGRATPLKRRCGDLLGLSTCLYHVGTVHLNLGGFASARDALETALKLQRDIGFVRGEAASLNALGHLDLDLGNGSQASYRFRRALRLQRAAGVLANRDEAVVLQSSCHAAAIRGDMKAARALHRALLALPMSNVAVDDLGAAAASLAAVLTARRRPREALRAVETFRDAEAARERAGAGGEPGPAPSTRVQIGLAFEEAQALLRMGDATGAIAAARRSLALGRVLPAAQRHLVLRLIAAKVVLARAMLRARKGTRARVMLEQAAIAAERLRDLQVSPTVRMGVVEWCRVVADARIEARLAKGRTGPRRAWDVARDLKAGELRSTLAHVRRIGSDAAVAVEAEIRHLAALPSPTRADMRRLVDLGSRFQDLVTRRSRQRIALQPSSPQAIAAVVGPRTAVLEYHVGSERSWLFILHEDRVQAVELPLPDQRLESAVARLLQPLRMAAADEDPASRLLAFDLDLARRLHRELLEPALRLLPDDVRRVVVIPDGPLHALPFDILVSKGAPVTSLASRGSAVRRSRYVADDLIVSTVPSAPLLLRRRAWQPSTRVLAVGWSPPGNVELRLPDGPRVLGPLPGAEAEARAIAGLGGGMAPLVGASATAVEILRAAASADIVHIAAHAFSDTRTPELSGLVVAGKAGGADFLTADRIARAALRASVVMLSGCDTASGRIRRSEGVLGLSRAFLEAGALAVVANLWPVDDAASRELAIRFHEQLLAGADAAAALAGARRHLREGDGGAGQDHSHPFYWAAPTFVGTAAHVAAIERSSRSLHPATRHLA